MTTIAVLGLGQMGRPIARNLCVAGFAVRAWNRSSVALDPMVPRAATIADAVVGADVVLTMLADDAATEAVVFGENGVLDRAASGALHVAMSTISLAIVDRMGAAHAERGQRFVAAPVFGRPDAAAAAQLWIVPGGTETDLAALAPVFAALGRGTWPMPGPREAMLAKLLGNFLLAGTAELFAEAFTVGEKGGLTPESLLALYTGTLFGSPAVQRYGGSVASTVFEPAGFPLRLGLKDVGLALEAARSLEAPLPIGNLLCDHMTTAMARGRGHIDWAGLATVVRENAGLAPTRR